MRAYTEGEVLKDLREQFQAGRGENQAEKAVRLGFTAQYIYAVLGGARPLTKEMASALGYRETIVYHKKR